MRAYRLQEFVAHTSNVNCLKIGRKSSGVLVTGGDDRRVNMWAIGKSTAILSLSGHQSAVDSVTFDNAEEVVVAGAAGGTIKMWDLEEAKVVRTLTGHRSNCLSVDFHPFGSFFASGSLDTNLKVWDIRRKACVHTYKGHTRGVTQARFSPDGRLVASGSQDGSVRVWDLTAGRLLHEWRDHDHAISGVEFHPSEFMLASSAADRMVRLWDLDSFEQVDMAGPEATGVRAITFSSGGECLLSAVQDGLRVWGWEPARQHDTVEVPWAKVHDITQHGDKLIGCSFNHSFVGVWVVDLARTKPFVGTFADATALGAAGAVQHAVLGPPPATPPQRTPPADTGGVQLYNNGRRLGATPGAASVLGLSARGTACPAVISACSAQAAAMPPTATVGTSMGDCLAAGLALAALQESATPEPCAGAGEAVGTQPGVAPDSACSSNKSALSVSSSSSLQQGRAGSRPASPQVTPALAPAAEAPSRAVGLAPGLTMLQDSAGS